MTVIKAFLSLSLISMSFIPFFRTKLQVKMLEYRKNKGTFFLNEEVFNGSLQS